jgi:hypothetical protein
MPLRRSILFFTVTGACLLGQLSPVRADSPLTSTDLASAYQELSVVRLARQEKVLQGEVLEFLLSSAPSDRKAAVINALGWNIEGQNNGERFLEGLAAARGVRVEDLTFQDLSPEDRFVLGYLLAMDDYSNLSPLQPNASEPLWNATPLELLSQAAYALPNDFTVHFVWAIVQGQANFSSSWCSIYLTPKLVLEQFPPKKRNMREEAVEGAMSYLKEYESSCNMPAASSRDFPANRQPT